MKRSSNIQPLNLCVYRYPDNLELQQQRNKRQIPSLPHITTTKEFKKMKFFSYSSFIPTESPFVITMIKLLINSIEQNSHLNGKWSNNSLQIAVSFDIDEITRKIMFLSILNGEKMILKLIKERNIEFILSLLRKILKQFYPRLIHFLNIDLLPVTSTPLYDSTMRPNPAFNSVVKHAVLRSSRTIIDTAAFVMIHLFHIWEYSTNPLEAKKDIVQNFGNLIVSFECKPKLIDKDDITPESCLLRIIMETTNVSFWNILTGHRVFEAFNITKDNEKILSRKVRKCNMFPSIPNIMKYDIPHLKMPIQYFFKSINVDFTESNTSPPVSIVLAESDQSSFS